MLKLLKVGSSLSPRAKWIDPLLWIIALAVLVGSFAANYYWPAFPAYLKVVLWLFVAAVAIVLIGLTEKGLALFKFSKEARTELRKVHWPTRQETLQTTLMVVIMVVLVGLFLWGVDALFIWAVNGLTGQRG